MARARNQANWRHRLSKIEEETGLKDRSNRQQGLIPNKFLLLMVDTLHNKLINQTAEIILTSDGLATSISS